MQDQTGYQPEPHHESELIEALEPDQLAEASARSLPRVQVSRSTEIFLGALRVFVIVVTGLVVYTFVVQLVRTP